MNDKRTRYTCHSTQIRKHVFLCIRVENAYLSLCRRSSDMLRQIFAVRQRETHLWEKKRVKLFYFHKTTGPPHSTAYEI